MERTWFQVMNSLSRHFESEAHPASVFCDLRGSPNYLRKRLPPSVSVDWGISVYLPLGLVTDHIPLAGQKPMERLSPPLGLMFSPPPTRAFQHYMYFEGLCEPLIVQICIVLFLGSRGLCKTNGSHHHFSATPSI